jgi:hypothetical protein
MYILHLDSSVVNIMPHVLLLCILYSLSFLWIYLGTNFTHFTPKFLSSILLRTRISTYIKPLYKLYILTYIWFFFLFSFFCGAGINSRASCMLGKCSPIQLHRWPKDAAFKLDFLRSCADASCAVWSEHYRSKWWCASSVHGIRRLM